MSNKLIRRMAVIASFAALSFVLYLLKFNLPFVFPGFLEIQFSNIPVYIVGFALGPIDTIALVIVRFFLKLPFTSTAGVGEIADLLIGLSCGVVSSIVYKKNKSKKGAIYSLLFSSLAWVIVAIIINWSFLTKFYINMLCNGDVQLFVNYCSIIPGINASNYMSRYLLFAILPFNLLLSTLVGLLTFIIYKRISILLKRFTKLNSDNAKINK